MKAVKPEGFPADWKSSPIWSMYRRVSRKHDGNEPHLSVYRDLGVVSREGRTDNWNRVSEDTSSYQLVLPGDLVVNKMKAWQGSMGVSMLRGVVSPAYFVYEPLHQTDHRFMHHLLRSKPFIDAYGRMSKGIRVGQWDLDPWAFSRVPVSLPPASDQARITDLLENSLQDLDAVIEKQRALIEKLKLRRSSTLLRAISGADRDGEKVLSRTSWMGAIPSHWQFGNIRRFAAMKTGHTPSRNVPEYWVDATIPWIGLADVWQLRGGRTTYVTETSEKINELGLKNSAAELLPAGTVVLSRTASVGFTGIMPEPMATSQHYWNWVCGSQLIPQFLMYVFRAMRQEFDALSAGATHKTIYEGDAASLKIPVPPLDEQREIVVHLRSMIAKIDTLIAKSERLIGLSQERRAALITAAVTGQLDIAGTSDTTETMTLEVAI